MVFDPTYPDIYGSSFKECEWKNFYGNIEEPNLVGVPETFGKEVDL